MTWSEGLNWLSVGLAGVTAFAWIKAATSDVKGAYKPDESLRFGETIVIDGGEVGNPNAGGIFVSGDKGEWIDLPKTMRLQSIWNARAAWLSAATAGAQGLAMLAAKTGK